MIQFKPSNQTSERQTILEHSSGQSRPRLTMQKSLFLGLLAVSVPVFFLCASSFNSRQQTNSSDVVPVRRENIQVKISASGTIIPEREVKLSPKQAGLLKELFVKEGDAVKRGQLIAVIDDSNLRGQLDASTAGYLAAQSNLLKFQRGNRPQEISQSELKLQHAKLAVSATEIQIKRLENQLKAHTATLNKDREYAKRQRALSDEGAVSSQDALNAETQAEVSLAQLSSAKEEIEDAKKKREQSLIDLAHQEKQTELAKEGFRKEEIEYAKNSALQSKGNLNYLQSLVNDMRIRAPFAGVITQKYAEIGSFVTPSAAAATSSATSSSIVLLSGKLEVVAQVPESVIENIVIDQDVEVRATAIKSKVFGGKVSQIAPAATSSSNVTVFEVHVRLDENKAQDLRSGMNVTASFLCGKNKTQLVIPSICAVSKDGRKGVYVRRKERGLEFRPVDFGAFLGADIVINSGLKEGDLVCRELSDDELAGNGFASGFKPPFGGR